MLEQYSNLYFPMHVHTSLGSIRDSILRIEDYIKEADKRHMPCLAITDHGSLSAVYYFINICSQYNIKPIIGMEAYIVDDCEQKDNDHRHNYHILLISRNEQGFKNLLSIHNYAQLRGFYYKPRIDMKIIRQNNWGEGIIATTACINGQVPFLLYNRRYVEALSCLQSYLNTFDRVYLEIQTGKNNIVQHTVNDMLVNISRDTGIPIIVTNDIHYLNEEDYMLHNCYLPAFKDKKVKNNGVWPYIYPDDCYWFMTKQDIIDNFHYTDIVTREIVEEGLNNAASLALECARSMSIPELQIPSSGYENEEQIFLGKLNQAMKDKELLGKSDYRVRLEYEISVIKQKQLIGYFLIVEDYIVWAKNNNIAVGPGRGSAVGSLVCYLLGITKLDPLKYNLMFERFLDPQRESIADIDIDISSEDRDKVFDYLQNKYGTDHCAKISTISILKARSAFRFAADIYDLPAKESMTLSKRIPDSIKTEDNIKVKNVSLSELAVSDVSVGNIKRQYPAIFNMAEKLEGLPDHVSIHPAGLIISKNSLNDILPLVKNNDSTIMATSLTMEDAEKFLIKFDLLGLDTVKYIDQTAKDTGDYFQYDTNNYDNSVLWEVLNCQYTLGLFQISGQLYKWKMPQIRPRSLEELAIVLALLRGPCVSTGADEIFIKIKQGRKKIKKIHPIYDEITKNTNGIILFQEQVMELAVKIGMDLTTGYQILKAAAKKKKDKVSEYKTQFIELARYKDMTPDKAEQIFNIIENSSSYLFNKSHAFIYAALCYCSAYYKYYHTNIFMKNVINVAYETGNTAIYSALSQDCKNIGIEFLPPDINHSERLCTIEDNKIRMGLIMIKGLGDKAIETIIQKRKEKGNFKSLAEFLTFIDDKRTINSKKLKIMVISGLFDFEHKSRLELYQWLCQDYLKCQPNDIEEILPSCKITMTTKATKELQEVFFGGTYLEQLYTVNTIQ